jgi:cysteinyl-tRNA synthetase
MFYGSKAEQDMHMRIARKVRPVVHPSVQAALEDDLNTSDAITALRALFKESDDAEIYSSLIESCEFLGLFDPQTIGAYFRGVTGTNLGYETTFQIHDVVQRLKVAIINRDNGRVNALMKNLSERNIGVERRSDGDVKLMPLEVQKSKVDEIGKLLELRAFARKNRDFKEADRIRDELKAKGIEIRDNPDGSVSVEVR